MRGIFIRWPHSLIKQCKHLSALTSSFCVMEEVELLVEKDCINFKLRGDGKFRSHVALRA